LRIATAEPHHGQPLSLLLPEFGLPRAWQAGGRKSHRDQSLFPPRTREVQFDEKWSFVAKKEKNCDPTDPADDRKGDTWDHVAIDAESRLVVRVVPGERTSESVVAVVEDFKRRTARKTYRFSKGWRDHESVTDLTMDVHNFCWPVRTLRIKDEEGDWRKRSPAMAAGLADHVWSIPEWLAFPSVQRR
jgi:hypothetical protein